MQRFRVALGVVIAAAAVGLVLDADTKLQRWLPGWTDFLQAHTEASAAGRKAYARGTNVTERSSSTARGAPSLAGLEDFGAAPDFSGISRWLNTPDGRPLTIDGLRGKVVLIDFWTYSCINCLRTLPHLEAWYRTYAPKGLVIVGVHTPEFAFEHDAANVRSAVDRLRVRYPVALDNDYGTWDAYGNQYWPAEYLIDKRGHVRHAHFGEGRYGETELLIRRLLSEPTTSLPVARSLADPTPQEETTAESYLGYERLQRYAGSRIVPGREASYRLPDSLAQNTLAYGGRWRVDDERITSGRGAVLRLHFHAKHVYLVLGGSGRVQVLVDGKPVRTVGVAGISRLYALLSYATTRDALLELRFTPGVSAYAFTFG